MRIASILMVVALLAVALPVAGQGSPYLVIDSNPCVVATRQEAPEKAPVPPAEPMYRAGYVAGARAWHLDQDGESKWLVLSTCAFLYEILQCVLDLPTCLDGVAEMVAAAAMSMDYSAGAVVAANGDSGPGVESFPLVDFIEWYEDYRG